MGDLSITGAGRLDGGTAAQRLRQAAQQFEEQFAAQILRPIAESGQDAEGPFASTDPGDAAFKGMLVDGLAEHAAGGLGIARLIEQELSGRIRRG